MTTKGNSSQKLSAIIENSIYFPCLSDKKPKIQWKGLFCKSSSKSTDGYYGSLTGHKNGFIVIDCDLIKNDDPELYYCGVLGFEILLNRLDSLRLIRKNIPVVKTKNGGLHYYFKYTKLINQDKTGVQKIDPSYFFIDNKYKYVKIDILSDNRYVINPKSTNYDIINDVPLIDMPQELIDIINGIDLPIEKHMEVDYDFYTKDEDEDRHNEKFSKKYNNNREIVIDENNLVKIIENIPTEYSNDYNSWIKIMIAIKTITSGTDVDGFILCDMFSSISKSKYKGVKDIQKHYDNIRIDKYKVTIGTLLYYSDIKVDELDLTKSKISIANEDKTKLEKDLNDLRNTNNGILIDISEDNKNNVLNVRYRNNNDEINVLNINKKNGIIYKDDEYIGYIKKEILIKEDLQGIHKNFSGDSICYLESKDLISFKNIKDPSNIINVKRPWDIDIDRILLQKYEKYETTEQKMLPNSKKKESLATLNMFLSDGVERIFKEEYNIVINQNNFYINQTFINSNEDDNKRSDEQLINCLIEKYPTLLTNFKKVNLNCNTLFSCEKGIWEEIYIGELRQFLIKCFYKIDLNEKETYYVESRCGINNLAIALTDKVIDKKFKDLLDDNISIFTLKDKVLDTQQFLDDLKLNNDLLNDIPYPGVKYIRDIKSSDCVLTHTNWSYSLDDSVKYRSEVVDFFNKLFPVEEERIIILKYLSGLLHGRREDKYFIALTDKRSGNNGKSTFRLLLESFFGVTDYFKKDDNFLLKKSNSKDINAHDAGLNHFKGKRILLMEECKKYSKFDGNTIKQICGGKYTMQGRPMHESTQFTFTFQAGVFVIFNEGDCPQFDSSDGAFLDRMIVCPMRSKFVLNETEINEDDYTYLKIKGIEKKFPLWNSSLLDFLLSYLTNEGTPELHELPESMLEWKNNIVDNINPLNNWLSENIEITKNDEDMLQIKDIKDRFRAEQNIHNIKTNLNYFNMNVKIYYTSKKLRFVERFRYYDNKIQIEKRDLMFGIKFFETDLN